MPVQIPYLNVVLPLPVVIEARVVTFLIIKMHVALALVNLTKEEYPKF